MDDFLSTQAGVYSTIEKPEPEVTPEEQERIEQERKEDAHHRIGEVVEGLEDTSKRKHHEIGSDFGEWVEAREEKIEEPAQIEEQKRTPEESQQPPESKETKAEEPKIPEPEEEPEPEPEAGANAQAIAKQVAIEVARTAASQADVSSINDKLDQLPEGLFNMDGTAGSGNVPMLGINGTWYYGTVEGGGGLDLDSKVCFGYSISGTTVTIYSGEVHHGANAVIEVAEKELNFSALGNNDYYVFVEYTNGSTAVVADPDTTRPVSDGATFRCWLYIFTKDGTAITLKRVGHFGNIEIPGAYG